MKAEGAKQVKIFDITLRDGSQSKVATRVKLDDLLKVARKLADSGIYGAETWGGATFDVCVRYLREDPWERARILKEAMPNVKSMMLIRGQNLVAYTNFPDDLVYKFVHAAAVVCQMVGVFHLRKQIIGVQHRFFGDVPQAVPAVHSNVGVSADQHAEMPVEGLNAPDGFRGVRVGI